MRAILTPEMIDLHAARAFWQQVLRPVGPACTHCGCIFDGISAARWMDGSRLQCSSCNTWQTWQSNTILCGAAIDERDLFVLAHMLQRHHGTAEIAERVNISTDTVLRWRRRLQDLA